jgi:ATP-dependent DNA helicase RecG
MDSMQTEIAYLKGVGPERARLLKEELNIKTFQDLLHFFRTAILIAVDFTQSTSFPTPMRKSRSKE